MFGVDLLLHVGHRVHAVENRYLACVGWRLERIDADDLLELVELNDDERVLEHSTVGGRETAEQQVGATLSGAVVYEVRQTPVRRTTAVAIRGHRLLLLLLLERRRRCAARLADSDCYSCV